MASLAIDPTKPAQGVPASKAELRDNLANIQARTLDVEDYRGANADTVAGNTAMWQAAMAALNTAGGGFLHYSRNYELNGQIDIPSDVTIFGRGFELYVNPSASADVLRVAGNRITLFNVRGRAPSNAEGWLIHAGNFNDLQVLDSEFYGDGGAVGSGSQNNAPFSMLRFTDIDIRRMLIQGNRFHDCAIAVHVNDSDGSNDEFFDIKVLANWFNNVRNCFGVNSPGTAGQGARKVIFAHNTAGNVIKPNGTVFAIADFAGVFDLLIAHNQISRWVGRGFWLEDDCEQFAILNNIMRDGIADDSVTVGVSSGDGNKDTIHILRSRDGEIVGNQITNVLVKAAAINCHEDGSGNSPGVDIIGNKVTKVRNRGAGNTFGIRREGDDSSGRFSWIANNKVRDVQGQSAGVARGISTNTAASMHDNDVEDVDGPAYVFRSFTNNRRPTHHHNRSAGSTGWNGAHVLLSGVAGVTREEFPQTRRYSLPQPDQAPDPLFSPSDLTPSLWLEMDDGQLRGATSGTFDGDMTDEAAVLAALEGDEFLTQWDDQSGNANHFSQATTGQQPGWLQASESDFGAAVLEWDGSDDTLDGTAQLDLSGGQFSLAVVFEVDNAESEQAIFLTRHSNGSRFSLMVRNGEVQAAFHDGTNAVATLSGPVSVGIRYIVQFLSDGSTSSLYVNGKAQTGTSSASHHSVADIKIGTRRGTSANLDGRVTAVITKVGAPWSDANRQELDRYLDDKYGADTIGWVEMLSLGRASNGTLSMSVVNGSSQSLLEQSIEWNGSALTKAAALLDVADAGQIEIREDAGALRARVVAPGSTIDLEAVLHGWILY